MVKRHETPSPSAYDLSVLTPSYGYGRYIAAAVESVMTCRLSVEHVIQDGGSTDETAEVVASLQERFGDRVKFRSEPDRGQSDALNKALEIAQGKWIAWLNADEYYLPDGVQRLVEHGEAVGADVVYGDSIFVDDEGRLIRLKPQHAFSEFVLRNYGAFISSCAVVFRRSVLWPRPWDTRLRLLMDNDLYLKLAVAGANFAYLKFPVAAFRVHEDRVSAEPPEAFASDYRVIEARHGRGGRFTQQAAELVHGGYKLASGAYLRQSRVRSLQGQSTLFLEDDEARRNVSNLVALYRGAR